MRLRTALVTARSAPAHERAVRTLMDWNIHVDEAMFLGGLYPVSAEAVTQVEVGGSAPVVLTRAADVTLKERRPLVLMVRNDHPAKTIKDLVEHSKKNPEQVNISNAGVGSSSHLIAALFANAAGIKVTQISYKGAGPALVDVIGGQVDGMFDQTNTALPQIEQKKVRALAVTSKIRLPQLKNIPTLNETVIPGFEASTWYGIYAPKGTPKAVLDKVQNAYLQVMKDKDYTGKMAAQAIQMLPEKDYLGTSLAQHTEAEVARWRAVAARSGLTLE